MKSVILLVSLFSSLPVLAKSAGAAIDPAFRGRIEKGCVRQLNAAPPADLKALNVSIESLCSCIADEHMIQAGKYERREDAEPYLRTITSFYATKTMPASKTLRERESPESARDEDFFLNCNQK